MSNLVIVAIPDENDHVWKISSEKVPHLTLLFLGDMGQISNLDKIVGFVEHAATTTLGRFYLSVDRRGELGADQADVLFFKKDRYSYKAIRDFRAALLQDNNIRTAYDSSTQFEGPWNPHLTLGYPAAPAKPDEKDYGFYSVEFNKIAVWTGDFEGSEFLLKDYWDEYETLDAVPMDVAMSSLSHVAKVSDTPWSQFKDSDYTDEQYARACLLDRGKDAGTTKERYGLPVREPDGTLNRNACHAAAAVLSSKGGTGSARGSKVKGTPEQIAKAKNKLVALYNGPLGEDVPEGLGSENSVKQTGIGSEFVLEHYGVKGMRWGVRKEDVSGAAKTVGKGAATAGKATAKGADVTLFELSANSDYVKNQIIWSASAKVKDELPAIQAKHGEYAKLSNRAKKPLSKEARAYRRDVKAAYLRSLEAAANEQTTASGSRRYTLKEWGQPNTSRYFWRVSTERNPARHTADPGTIDIRPIFDDEGYIIDFEIVEDSMAQSTSDIGAVFILEHYGIKGMHWGQRKAEPPTAVTPTAVSRVPHGTKRKTKIAVEGGENHPAHEDAVKVAQSRAKLKKSGTAALSNKELQEMARRLQLEAQVTDLTKSRGRKFVSRQIEQQGQQTVQKGLGAGTRRILKFA